MSAVGCPHCTFLNEPNRVKCAMCLRYLRKRGRKTTSDSATDGTQEDGSEAPPSSSAAPSQSLQGTCADSSAQTSAAPILTLFSTASGKPIQVSEEAIRKAKARLGSTLKDEDAELSAPVPLPPAPPSNQPVMTLFSTAAGRRVQVSAESMRKAKALLVLETDENQPPSGVITDSASLHHYSTGTEEFSTEAKTSNVREPAVPAPVHAARQSASAVPMGIAGGIRNSAIKRRGFVAPQRIGAVAASIRKDGATAAPRGKIAPLAFDAARFSSLSTTALPPLTAIASGSFFFPRGSLSPLLRQLLHMEDEASTCVLVEHWRGLLGRLGASTSHCSTEWCWHMVRSSLFKAHSLAVAAGSTIGAVSTIFQPTSVAMCLCYKYNTEIVEGRRPALRKMTEGDVAPASLVILYISEICEDKSCLHKRVVRVSDGSYHLKVSLDVPLSSLIRDGSLRVGLKVAVCGAKLLLSGQCSPVECNEQVVFSLSYNCVRPVASEARLGLCLSEPAPLPIKLVHPAGGLVPAIEGVVARVLPPFFVVQSTQDPMHPRTTLMVRNLHAQMQFQDNLVSLSSSSLAQSRTGEPSGTRLVRVTSALLRMGEDESLIQQWETCPPDVDATEDQGESRLPREGTTVVAYALNPSKAGNAAAPFLHAKLFYFPRRFQFEQIKAATNTPRTVLEDFASVSHTHVGACIDFVGVFVGSCKTEQGTFLLVVFADGNYTLLQVPLATKSREISFSYPATEFTPLIVLNATLVSTTDTVVGDDCGRVFASEYTTVAQRPIQSSLLPLMTRAASSVQQLQKSSRKVLARRDEIFRLAGTIPGQSCSFSNFDSSAAVALPAETLEPSAGGVGSSARVPYYLRQEASSAGRLPGRSGVVISESSARLSPSASTLYPSALAPPLRSAAQTLFHLYGNVIKLSWCRDGASLHKTTNLLCAEDFGAVSDCKTAVLVSPPCTFEEANMWFDVSWRYAHGSDDTCSATIRSPTVFTAMLEAVLPLQSVLEGQRDGEETVSDVDRRTVMRQLKSQYSTAELWWHYFRLAIVTDENCIMKVGCDEGSVNGPVLHSTGQWASLLTMLQKAFESAFFKFTVDQAIVRSVHYICNGCLVSDLFS